MLVTVNEMVAVCTREPLVPVTMRVNVPSFVPAAMVNVEAPAVSETGLKVPVGPNGATANERFTNPVYPPMSVTVTVKEVVVPRRVERLVGETVSVKLGTGLTVSDTEAVWTSAPLVAVIVNG